MRKNYLLTKTGKILEENDARVVGETVYWEEWVLLKNGDSMCFEFNDVVIAKMTCKRRLAEHRKSLGIAPRKKVSRKFALSIKNEENK